MAGETVDALVLAARFDQTGLDALPTAVNAALRKAQQGVPALDINTAPFQASLAKAGISAADFSAGFQDAINDFGGADALLKQLARDAENTATGSQKMAAGFRTAGAAAREASAGAQAWERGLTNIRAANDGSVAGFTASNRAVNLLRGGLTQLAVQATGTTGALGQVAQAAAFAAGGAGAIIGVAALTLAYGLLTKRTREAREEQERLLQAQRQRLAAGGGEDAGLRTTLAADQARIRDITREIAGWQRAIVEDAVRGLPTYGQELKLRKLIAEQRQIELAVAADQAALDQRHADEIAASLQRQQAQRISSLTAAPDLGLADAGTFREIRSEMAKQLEIVNAEGVALVDRIEAQQTYNRLREALLVPLRAAEAAQRAETEAIEASVRAQEAFLDALRRTNQERGEELRTAREALAGRIGPDAGAIDRGFEAAADAASRIKTPADLQQDIDEATQATLELAEATARWAIEEANALRESELAFDAAKPEKMARAVEDLVFGLSTVVDVLGLMDAQASKALGALQSIGVALAHGDILGAVAGGINFIGSAFGKDATQQEHEGIRAQNENTLATQRNTAAVERASTAGGLAATGATLAAISPEQRAALESLAKGSGQFGELAAGELDAILRDTGSSLEELQAAAEANGIEILDSKGRLVAGSLDQLNEAIKRAREEALEFRDDRASRARQEENLDKLNLGGRSEDPNLAAAQRTRDLQLEALHLSDEEEARIRALDLSTEAGRKAFLEWERDIVQRARDHRLTDTELGDFPGVDELLESAGLAADEIKALEEAAKEAAQQFGDFNLPPGFKRQGIGFDVMPFGPSRGNDGAALPLPDAHRFSNPFNAVGLPASPATGQVTVAPGGVHVEISVDGASDPQAVAVAIRNVLSGTLEQHLRNIGLKQSGDTMQLGLR